MLISVLQIERDQLRMMKLVDNTELQCVMKKCHFITLALKIITIFKHLPYFDSIRHFTTEIIKVFGDSIDVNKAHCKSM